MHGPAPVPPSRPRIRPARCAAVLARRCGLALAALALGVVVAPGTARAEDPALGGAAPTDAASAVVLDRVDLRDVALADACRLLSAESGMNLVPSAAAGRVQVTLYLRNVRAADAVESLCAAHGLWSRRDARTGIVRIHTVEEYRLDRTQVVEERTEYFTLRYPNAMDVGHAVRDLFGSRVSLGTSGDDGWEAEDLEDRFERFDLVDERAQGLGTRTGTGTSGTTTNADGTTTSSRGERRRSGRSSDDAGNGGARIDDDAPRPRPSALPKDVTADDIRAIESQRAGGSTPVVPGASLPIRVTISRRRKQVVVRTADTAAMEQIRTLVERLDTATSLVLLEVRILSVELDDGASSFFEYQWAGTRTAGAFSGGNIVQPVPPALGPAGTGLRAGELSFQYVDANFAARLQALERENRVRTLATPILLTANDEVSRLFVGREVPINRTFAGGQVVQSDSGTTTTPGTTQIEFRPVGTTLLMTPNIHADRTVTLRIVQESSDVNSTAPVLVPDGTGFRQQTVPVVSSQTVAGTLVAKSELAVAFGGLIEKSIVAEESKVPFLGDIPILSLAFKRKSDREVRRELVVVVRPFVFATAEEAEAKSRELLRRRDAGPAAIDEPPTGTKPDGR